MDKGFPVLSRRLQFGHANIRQVADSVKKLQSGSQQSSLARRLNITTSEAEAGVPVEDIDVWNETVAETPALQSAVNAYFKSLVDAVSRTAQFSIAKYHIDAISTCFLYGSGAGYKKIDKELVSKELKQEYTEIANRFLLPSPADFLHPKPMLIPSLMSGTGVLGYIGPFFIEYNLNPDLLPIQYPFTYAHEMAHVLGISSEAEANLYGFLVCSRSSIPEIRFSAYLAIFPYVLSNAYNLLSKEDFVQWKETVSSEIKKLYNEKNLYWQALYNPLIGNLQQVAYNWYLKQNNIPSGQKNYSEVIGLLIALWFGE
jgi:hypothetical protein